MHVSVMSGMGKGASKLLHSWEVLACQMLWLTSWKIVNKSSCSCAACIAKLLGQSERLASPYLVTPLASFLTRLLLDIDCTVYFPKVKEKLFRPGRISTPCQAQPCTHRLPDRQWLPPFSSIVPWSLNATPHPHISSASPELPAHKNFSLHCY